MSASCLHTLDDEGIFFFAFMKALNFSHENREQVRNIRETE